MSLLSKYDLVFHIKIIFIKLKSPVYFSMYDFNSDLDDLRAEASITSNENTSKSVLERMLGEISTHLTAWNLLSGKKPLVVSFYEKDNSAQLPNRVLGLGCKLGTYDLSKVTKIGDLVMIDGIPEYMPIDTRDKQIINTNRHISRIRTEYAPYFVD